MNAQNWDYIENDFTKPEYYSNILRLIKFIKSSGLSNRVYGVKSLDKLILSKYNPIDVHKEALHINFDPITNKWHFQHYSAPLNDPDFDHKYELHKGIEKFQEFVKMIKW
ncbi:MAG: hypothetical protein ACJ748_15415 [Flavisolibacter sp.]